MTRAKLSFMVAGESVATYERMNQIYKKNSNKKVLQKRIQILTTEEDNIDYMASLG